MSEIDQLLAGGAALPKGDSGMFAELYEAKDADMVAQSERNRR